MFPWSLTPIRFLFRSVKIDAKQKMRHLELAYPSGAAGYEYF